MAHSVYQSHATDLTTSNFTIQTVCFNLITLINFIELMKQYFCGREQPTTKVLQISKLHLIQYSYVWS